MNAWEGSWEFSSRGSERLNKICLKLHSRIYTEIPNVWTGLFNFNLSPVGKLASETDEFTSQLTPKDENHTCDLIKQLFKNKITVDENKLCEIPCNLLNKMLVAIKEDLSELEFCALCKRIASWNNIDLIETVLTTVVLSKLREKKESSAYVIFSIKELAFSKPDVFCLNVLIPLLRDDSLEFADSELLTSIFPILPVTQIDSVILCLTKKENFKESDWLLLQPLIKNLSQSSLTNVIACLQRFSDKFVRSQTFGRFLVHFCQNWESNINKSLLVTVVEKHETLFKRQALKYLK